MKEKLSTLGEVWLLRVIAVAAVVSASSFLELKERIAVTDADIWWHLRVGEWIWRSHSVPQTGLFSQAANQGWVAYSWGFETLAAGFQHAFGLVGLLWLLVALEVLIASLLFLAQYSLSKRFWFSVTGTGLGIWAIYHAITIRPVLVTISLYTLTLATLLMVRRGANQRFLWVLPPVFLLWANCHIQFVYGLFIVGAFLAEICVQALVSKFKLTTDLQPNPVSLLDATVVLVGCVLATLVGPYSIRLYEVIFDLASNRQAYDQLTDLLAMNFRMSGHYVEVFIIIAAAFALGWKKKWDVFASVVLLTSAVFAFRSTRDAWFVCMSALLFIASVRAGESILQIRETAKVTGPGLVFASVALVIFAFTHGVTNASMFEVVKTGFPVSAADFVRSNGLSEPLYNNMGWGGFLDWYLPEHSTSIDGRTDLCGADRLTLHVDVLNGRTSPLQDPQLLAARTIVLDRRYPLSVVLRQFGRYSLVYQDEQAVVYVRQQ